MIPRLLLLVPLTLAACSAHPISTPDSASTAAVDGRRPDQPSAHGPVLRDDLPPPPGARTDDPAPVSSETDPGAGGIDLSPVSAAPAPETPEPPETAEPTADPAPWTTVARLPGVPERRLATRAARAEIDADCAGHVPPAALPFATPWMDVAQGRIAAVAEGEGTVMLYLRDPDGDWHCGLRRAEAAARAGRWRLHVGTLLENAPVPPVRVRIEHAIP
jgi:hypothetical protein